MTANTEVRKGKHSATVTKSKTSANPLVKSLMSLAQSNPVFKSMATILSFRERDRFGLSVRALSITMSNEGYYYPRPEIEKVFEALAELGIASVERGPNGRITGLVRVKYSFASIGQAALHGKDLVPYKRLVEANFDEVPPAVKNRGSFNQGRTRKKSTYRNETNATSLTDSITNKRNSAITAVINGEKVIIPLNSKITAEDIGNMILDLHNQNE